MSNKEVIAAFDLDGTLTRRDTLIDVLREAVGSRRLIAGLLINGPLLLKCLIGRAPRDNAKESLLAYFFRGWPEAEFDGWCRAYSLRRLPLLMKKEALVRCRWHRQQGHRLVCVSASVRNWIAPWALQYGFSRVIATELEAMGGVMTGRFKGRNCKGPEKVRRFCELFPDRDRYTLFAYGDGRGDEALLAFADQAFFRRYE